MEAYEPLKPAGWRRRRILAVALVPLLAAIVIWSLESGRWLVIYNDSREVMGEIQIRIGEQQWTVQDMEPRDSRRFRVRARETAEILVQVTQWENEAPFRERLDWRGISRITLRLGSDHTVVSTSEGAFWERWLNW